MSARVLVEPAARPERGLGIERRPARLDHREDRRARHRSSRRRASPCGAAGAAARRRPGTATAPAPSAVDRANLGVEKRVGRRARSRPSAARHAARELEPARARVRDVVGAVAADIAQRADRDDQVVVLVEERRGVELNRAAGERLRHAELDAAAAFGLQRPDCR